MVADLHDNLSNRLYALKIITSQLENPSLLPHKRKSLSMRLKDLTDFTLLTISSFMWSFDPKNNTLNALADKLKVFSNVTVGSIISEEVTVLLTELESGASIEPQQANHLLMAFQEILTNMIKHTQPERIHSQILLQRNRLYIQIHNFFALLPPTKLPPLPGDPTTRESYGLNTLTLRIQALGGDIQFTEDLDGQYCQLSIPFSTKKTKLVNVLKFTTNEQYCNY